MTNHRASFERQKIPSLVFCSAFRTVLLIAIALLAASAGPANALPQEGAVHWKVFDGAQVKLAEKTPIAWNIYEPEKKDKKDKKNSNLVLLLLGHRYLMIDTRAKAVYEVPLARLHAQDKDFDSDDLTQSTPLVPSSDWTSRDVGPAELIQFTLADYGRVLTLQLPHMPDLRAFY